METVLAILLAGGAGERLAPLTRDTAKPAVCFGGVYRIIDFTLSNCINSDLRRIFILTQYKSLDLIRHVRDEILAVYFADTLKGRQMKSDGTYARRTLPGGKRAVSSQERLLKAAVVGTK